MIADFKPARIALGTGNAASQLRGRTLTTHQTIKQTNKQKAKTTYRKVLKTYTVMFVCLFIFLRQQKLCSKWPNLWCVLNVEHCEWLWAFCQQAQWYLQCSRFGGHESMVLEGNRSLGHYFSDWNPASQIQALCLHGKQGIELYAMLDGKKNKGEREHTSNFPFHFNHHFFSSWFPAELQGKKL